MFYFDYLRISKYSTFRRPQFKYQASTLQPRSAAEPRPYYAHSGQMFGLECPTTSADEFEFDLALFNLTNLDSFNLSC